MQNTLSQLRPEDLLILHDAQDQLSSHTGRQIVLIAYDV